MSFISKPLSTFECECSQSSYQDHSQDDPLSKNDFDHLPSSSRTGHYDYETFCGTNNSARCVEYDPAMKFPLKLHWVLLKAEMEGLSDIISWSIHGRAFVMSNREKFSEIFIPVYFNQTKTNSFFRQLHIYGFKRITKGPDKGAYYQELFLRGKPFLAYRILRHRGNGTKNVSLSSTATDPDFYDMPFLEGTPAWNVSTLPSLCSNHLDLRKRSSSLSCFSSFSNDDAGTVDSIDLHIHQTQYKDFLRDEGDINTIFSGDSENSISDLSSFCCDDLYTMQDSKSF